MTSPTQMGSLYIVATPIGNLSDFSQRAIDILKMVDLIAAEDTRHSRKLLHHYQIDKPLLSLHEHNEDSSTDHCMKQLLDGASIAVISDAGTPLISDPGYMFVNRAIEMGVNVVPIPGPCAFIAALCAAGLPTDRVCFDGFLPAKSAARQKVLTELRTETRTLIFYESPHRIMQALQDIIEVLGAQRQIVVARELTKTFEQFYRGGSESVYDTLLQHPEQIKGEFVIMIKGSEQARTVTYPSDQVLIALLNELPLKQAVGLCVQITGEQKNTLYQRALELKASQENN